MNKILSLALLLAPAALFAQQADDSVVQWERIVGVITAPNVDNPVAGIKAGAGPWTGHHAQWDVGLQCRHRQSGNHRHGGSQTEFRGQCALPWTTRWFAGRVPQP